MVDLGSSSAPFRPEHVVVKARLIWAGHTVKVAGKWAGDWAIGVVEEHFWGLPSWKPRLVLLINHPFHDGDTVLVSGEREQGILTRHLTIVSIMACGSYYSHAGVDAKP
jgi:hypothetical protein